MQNPAAGLGRREAQRCKNEGRAKRAKFFADAGPGRRGTCARAGGLCGLPQGPKVASDFAEPRMALDGFGQVFHAEVNGAQGDVLALRVVTEPVQCARFAALAVLPDRKPKVV